MKYSIGQLKKQKYFYPADIIVYTLIAVIITVLLCVYLIPDKNSGLEEVEIYYKETLIYSYNFESNKSEIQEGNGVEITETTVDGLLKVTLVMDEGADVVEIGVDYAKITESDSSRYPDCIYGFDPITGGGDVIICLPHHIKLVGVGTALITNEVKL